MEYTSGGYKVILSIEREALKVPKRVWIDRKGYNLICYWLSVDERAEAREEYSFMLADRIIDVNVMSIVKV